VDQDRDAGQRMHIGEIADRTGLSLRTIRHYDDVGILPADSRTEGGFRLYTDDDVERLLLIRRMKPLGFTLEEMQELLRVTDALDAEGDPARREMLRTSLDSFRSSAIERREKLAQTLARADEFIERLNRY
jgi:MerR family copper efflux transcriptional regulator